MVSAAVAYKHRHKHMYLVTRLKPASPTNQHFLTQNLAAVFSRPFRWPRAWCRWQYSCFCTSCMSSGRNGGGPRMLCPHCYSIRNERTKIIAMCQLLVTCHSNQQQAAFRSLTMFRIKNFHTWNFCVDFSLYKWATYKIICCRKNWVLIFIY